MLWSDRIEEMLLSATYICFNSFRNYARFHSKKHFPIIFKVFLLLHLLAAHVYIAIMFIIVHVYWNERTRIALIVQESEWENDVLWFKHETQIAKHNNIYIHNCNVVSILRTVFFLFLITNMCAIKTIKATISKAHITIHIIQKANNKGDEREKSQVVKLEKYL